MNMLSMFEPWFHIKFVSILYMRSPINKFFCGFNYTMVWLLHSSSETLLFAAHWHYVEWCFFFYCLFFTWYWLTRHVEAFQRNVNAYGLGTSIFWYVQVVCLCFDQVGVLVLITLMAVVSRTTIFGQHHFLQIFSCYRKVLHNRQLNLANDV